MTGGKIHTAIGLMSGTSLDGIDAALIRTDGHSVVERLAFKTYPYDGVLREAVKTCFGLSHDDDGRVKQAEALITQAHIEAVRDFGYRADVIGFHGQTIFHDPANRMTWQIGDGAELARAAEMAVVYDFRSNDVRHGGQGAPLIPLYHRVMAQSAGLEMPCAIVNIGGVANLTWLGGRNEDVIAFDTGPGNALIDDWMRLRAGLDYDAGGNHALAGTIDKAILMALLDHPYFTAPAPKSLDRNAFSLEAVSALPLEDGAATLAGFTCEAIIRGLALCPVRPRAIYVTGGGRKNAFIMNALARRSGLAVQAVDALGWDGDAMEAEGFAYLAVRALLGLTLSLPGTTGCPKPLTGGRIARAVAEKTSAG